MVTHQAVNRLVINSNYVQISSGDVLAQISSVSFDAATFEIWGALLNGARLSLYGKQEVDIRELLGFLQAQQISIVWMTAGLFHQVVDQGAGVPSSIRQLLAGGDVLSVSHVRRLLEQWEGCTLINGYGPTEGTTFSTCCCISEAGSLQRTVPIGR